MRGKLMDGEAAPRRDYANPVEQVFSYARRAVPCGPSRPREQFRRRDARRASEMACTCSKLAERGTLMVTSTKCWFPRPAHADALGRYQAIHVRDGCGNALLQACGSRVEQCVQSALSQPRPDPNHDRGDNERGDGVGVLQPRDASPLADHTAAIPRNHDKSAPHIGGEMQRIGFERLTRIFAGHTRERRASGSNQFPSPDPESK